MIIVSQSCDCGGGGGVGAFLVFLWWTGWRISGWRLVACDERVRTIDGHLTVWTVILVHGQHGQHFLVNLPDVARVRAIVLLLERMLLLQLLLQLQLLLVVQMMLTAYVVIRQTWLQIVAIQHNNARSGAPAIPLL